jgi:hypothetical protein
MCNGVCPYCIAELGERTRSSTLYKWMEYVNWWKAIYCDLNEGLYYNRETLLMTSVLNTLNVSVTKRKQLPVCRHSVMLCTAWCLRLSVTSHELSAVICSLQVRNWTSAFTLRVNVRLRRFCAFICGFVTEGFIVLDSVPVEWILRVYWLERDMTDLVEVEVTPDRLLEGLRNAAKRIRKTRVCALVLNPRTPPPASRIRNKPLDYGIRCLCGDLVVRIETDDGFWIIKEIPCLLPDLVLLVI